jgi:hypothetical protein
MGIKGCAMKDYEKYELDLRAKFAEQNPHPTSEQLAANYRENTKLVMKFLAQKNVDAIERERIGRINDWLASAWRGSRRTPVERER